MTNIYTNKIQDTERIISKSSEELKTLSLYRLIIFVASLALILFLANARAMPLVLVTAPICVLVFIFLLREYNKIFDTKTYAGFIKEINENELLRRQNKLSIFPTGESYADRNHAYVSDLDIFGPHSLFQLIDRTTTEAGAELLAGWLSEPASKDGITKRQNAVRELAPKLEWRQEFQAAGMHSKNVKRDFGKLIKWIEEPVILMPKQNKHLIVSIMLAILSTMAVSYFIYGLIITTEKFAIAFLIPLILSLIINGQFLKRFAHISEEIILNTQYNIQTLGSYQSLINKIESEQFEAEILRNQQSFFSQGPYSASKEINRLRKILEIFQQKGTKKTIGTNAFYNIFNSLWLLDVHLILLTEKWKLKNSAYVRLWAAAVSEFETLSSIAGFTFSNPDFTFPEVVDEPYLIEFEKLGHPLILPEQRITNDFQLNGRGHITMITGSNMAGKSTFLRTVGLNLTLALMGAPCCARSGRVSQLKVFTSMRTQDNLEEGVSSFYAELKKIEQLLKLIESGEPIFFLLDEMFKGTNSLDRYKGGVSLIKQLSELNAFGLISTHDLELAKLAGNYMIVDNYSFHSEIQGEEMIFNYTLTKGICKDFNASELMRKSGIKILADI